MTHTPGPWKYDEFVYGADGSKVCDPHADTQDNDEREANARLIAAAPVLVDAGDKLIGDARFVPTNTGSKHGKWMVSAEALNELRAAIALAKGDKE